MTMMNRQKGWDGGYGSGLVGCLLTPRAQNKQVVGRNYPGVGVLAPDLTSRKGVDSPLSQHVRTSARQRGGGKSKERKFAHHHKKTSVSYPVMPLNDAPNVNSCKKKRDGSGKIIRAYCLKRWQRGVRGGFCFMHDSTVKITTVKKYTLDVSPRRTNPVEQKRNVGRLWGKNGVAQTVTQSGKWSLRCTHAWIS